MTLLVYYSVVGVAARNCQGILTGNKIIKLPIDKTHQYPI